MTPNFDRKIEGSEMIKFWNILSETHLKLLMLLKGHSLQNCPVAIKFCHDIFFHVSVSQFQLLLFAFSFTFGDLSSHYY